MTGRPPKMHVDDRQARSVHLNVHWSEIASRHRAEEARAIAKGRTDKAQFRREAAVTAEKRAKKHWLAAERFAKAASRARTARRLNDEHSAERVAQAEALAAQTPRAARLSPQEQRRQEKAESKRARLLREGSVARQREEKAAQVDYDHRTAAGQREIQIRGPSIGKKASFADYGSLIARQSDRRPERLLALEKYDTLVHRALKGDVAAPKYERGVDTSHGPADVAEDRAEAKEELARLRAYLGVENEALLRVRVFERMTFTWMEGQGMGEAERLGVVFLSAVDALARHYGLTRPARAVEVIESRLVAT